MPKVPHKTIISELTSNNENKRKKALKRLASIPEDIDYEDSEFIPNPRALRKHIPKLAHLLKTHHSLEVRTWCAQYLGDLGQHSDESVEALRITIRESKDDHLIATCVYALGNYGAAAAAAVPDLLRLAKNADYEVRWRIAHAVDLIGHVLPRDVKLLTKLLDDPEALVRGYASGALLKWVKPSIKVLKKAMLIAKKDQDSFAAWEAHALAESWAKALNVKYDLCGMRP
ncbi:MAG TPA: HEAT repeat domain-containing protein [Gemmatales bacterium]|nr:HEAT repeat domain-containing protein [Gemmatales bacterium]